MDEDEDEIRVVLLGVAAVVMSVGVLMIERNKHRRTTLTDYENVFSEEEMTRPKHRGHRNRRIDMDYKMALFAKRDNDSRSFGEQFENGKVQDLEMDSNSTVIIGEDSKEVSSSNSCQYRSQRKQKHCTDYELLLERTCELIGNVVEAISSLSRDKVNVQALYDVVMKTQEFDETALVSAFDHLVKNERSALGFMVKSPELRKMWIENFLYKHQ